jgi:hypothetical protein
VPFLGVEAGKGRRLSGTAPANDLRVTSGGREAPSELSEAPVGDFLGLGVDLEDLRFARFDPDVGEDRLKRSPRAGSFSCDFQISLTPS